MSIADELLSAEIFTPSPAKSIRPYRGVKERAIVTSHRLALRRKYSINEQAISSGIHRVKAGVVNQSPCALVRGHRDAR